MFTTRPDRLRARVAEGAFADGRAKALERLVRRMPSAKAEAWLHAWDATTAGLIDFRRAADFWRLGYEYALEEYRLGFDPPVLDGASPDGPVATDRRPDAESTNATAGVIRP